MKVGFLQFSPHINDVHANVQRIQQLLAPIDFDLMVLPELANSGYLYPSTSDVLPVAESLDAPGEFLTSLQKIARQKDACLISGIAEVHAGVLNNAAVAVDKDGIQALYRKVHLYNTEKKLFSPGNSGFQVFDFKGVKIGMIICFDWIFPEAARTLALKGAQLIAHPANLVLPYCQSAMRTRSLENSVFTITANRIGTEILDDTHLTFTGSSQVTSPRGELLCTAPPDAPSVQVVEIDPTQALNKHISPNNHLFEDRRSDLYFK